MNRTGVKYPLIVEGIHLFRNIRNPNKYIKVARYTNDCHYYYKSFMHWDNGVTNVLGQRNNKLFRVSRRSLSEILEDYEEIPVDYSILP